MRVLVISHSYTGDGASQMLLGACSYWTKKLAWSIDALLPSSFNGEVVNSLVGAGIHPIKGKIDQTKYDFVLINCLQNIASVDQFSGVLPIALWAHEAETILNSDEVFLSKLRQRLSLVSKLVFQTEWQSDVFKDFISDRPKGTIHYVIGGLTRYASIKSSPKLDKIFRISNVAKLSPLKGQATLIEAVHSLSKTYPIHCEFIGGVEYLPLLSSNSRLIAQQNLNLFSFTGYVSRKVAVEKVINSDVFCFPSQSESLGLAPLEAALHKVPVILADIPVYQYVGWRDGVNCRMCVPNDVDSLATAIESMILDGNLRQKLADNGAIFASHFASSDFFDQITKAVL